MNKKIIKIATIETIKIFQFEGEETEEEDLEIMGTEEFNEQPAEVYVEIPIRRSKYYNSAGITVGVRLPCSPDKVDETIDKAKDIALGKVMDELPTIDEALENMRAKG